MQRMLPPSLVALLCVAMVIGSLVLPWPDSGWLPLIAGALVFSVGAWINVGHAKLFDSIGTNIKTFDDPDMLVRSGAFFWSRNPMYLGFTLTLLGIASALGAAVAFIGPVLFVIAANWWYIPFEERRMAATFGTDYDDYHSQVRRWFGRRSAA